MSIKKRIYLLTISPAIPVEDRHKLQDALRKLGYAIDGGGQMLDGSECDITFEKPSKNKGDSK